MPKEIDVFDHIKIKKDGSVGIIILLIGYTPRELYADMFPGAQYGYEYITMYDENQKRVEVRALNKYSIDDVTVITKKEFKSYIKKWKEKYKTKNVFLKRPKT